MKAIILLLSLGLFSCITAKPKLHKKKKHATSQTGSDPVYTPIPYDGSDPFGILINQADGAAATINTKISVQKELGMPYVRSTISLTGGPVNLNEYNTMVSNGFRVILNITYARQMVSGSTQVRTAPTNMTEYKSLLSNALSGIQPELVVIENEECNFTYYNMNAQQYLAELSAATEALHGKGIKVTNGGLTRTILSLLVYDDYRNRGMNREADDYASRCMQSDVINDLPELRNHAALQQRKSEMKQVVDGYKNIPIDYVNFHWYEPATEGTRNLTGQNINSVDMGAFKETVDYLRRTTGKDVISNELGQHSESPQIAQQMMQAVLDVKLPYAIWYSGDGGEGKAVAVNNGNGSLRPYGIAMRDFIKRMK